jgi:hypothetical protein
MIAEIDSIHVEEIGDRTRTVGESSIEGEAGVDQETPETFVNVETLLIQILKDERNSNSEDLTAVGATIQGEIIITEIIITTENRQ